MALKLTETQTISELASTLYDFLPATAHPLAQRTFTFGDAAARVGSSRFWHRGSKLPAITALLEGVWEFSPSSLEPLLLIVVREGIKYRLNKGDPVTREEIEGINKLLLDLHLKIPDLRDQEFLNSLPRASSTAAQTSKPSQPPSVSQVADPARLSELQSGYARLAQDTDSHQRGYELQDLLGEIFELYGLAPRGAFRVVGEEIDGSFEFQGETYLLEARWRRKPTRAGDLYAFQEKVERKSAWTRGVFISIGSFSADAIEAFAKGKAPRVFGFDGGDLAIILEGVCGLDEALRRKIRALSESGTFLERLS